MIESTPITGEVPVVSAPARTTVPVTAPNLNPARAYAIVGLRADDTSALFIIPEPTE